MEEEVVQHIAVTPEGKLVYISGDNEIVHEIVGVGDWHGIRYFKMGYTRKL